MERYKEEYADYLKWGIHDGVTNLAGELTIGVRMNMG
jgi:hypothetical protein